MSSLEEWCGAHPECHGFWEGHSEFLPKAERPINELKTKELCKLLWRWEEWWKECGGIQPAWEEVWRGLDADTQRNLVQQACHRSYIQETDTDLWGSLEENGLLIKLTRNGKAEGRVIGAFAFWVYYYKRRGQVKRWWVKLTEAPGAVISLLLEKAHKRVTSPKGQARIFIALSWIFVLVLFVAASGVGVDQLSGIFEMAAVEGTLPQWWETVAGYRYPVGVLTALGAWVAWFCFVERSVGRRGTDLLNRIFYSIPVSIFLLTSFLPPVWLFSNILLIVALVLYLLYLLYLLLLLPLAAYSENQWLERLIPWEWLRFLLLVVPFLGILLLSRRFNPDAASGWLRLLFGSFLCLRLWWKALDWLEENRRQAKRMAPESEREGSQDKQTAEVKKEGEKEKGEKAEGSDPLQRIWEALLGFYYRYPTEAFPTLLVVLSLLLAHLLWFRLQIAPITHPVSVDDETGSVFVTTPPWLSMEDRGEVIVGVTNHLNSTLALTVTLTVTNTGQIPGAEVAYLADGDGGAATGQMFFEVPSKGQANESLTIVTLSLHTHRCVPDLLLQVNMQGNHPPSAEPPPPITVPVLSCFLPAMYASSKTFLGWILQLAWAISQVSAAVLFASRGGGR